MPGPGRPQVDSDRTPGKRGGAGPSRPRIRLGSPEKQMGLHCHVGKAAGTAGPRKKNQNTGPSSDGKVFRPRIGKGKPEIKGKKRGLQCGAGFPAQIGTSSPEKKDGAAVLGRFSGWLQIGPGRQEKKRWGCSSREVFRPEMGIGSNPEEK